MSARRGNFGAFPRTPPSGDPPLASLRLSSSMGSITSATKVTPLASVVLDGFTIASDVLTCQHPGVYRMRIEAHIRPGTSGDVCEVGYRQNGGTDRWPIFDAMGAITAVAHRNCEVLVKLAAGDTVEFRAARASGSGNMTLYADSCFSLERVSRFQ